MSTETDICNIALGKVGGAGDQESGTGLIASINGTDRVSARCKLWFPIVRRRVIGDLAKIRKPFKETLKYLDLGSAATTGLAMGGWDYVFALPGNTIEIMRQIDEEFATIRASITEEAPIEYPFEISVEDTTKYLFTNDLSNTAGDSAFVQQVFDQTNTGTWTPEMIDAVATLLAAELVATVGAAAEQRTTLLAEYTTVNIPKAMSSNQAKDMPVKRIRANYKGGRSESIPTA